MNHRTLLTILTLGVALAGCGTSAADAVDAKSAPTDSTAPFVSTDCPELITNPDGDQYMSGCSDPAAKWRRIDPRPGIAMNIEPIPWEVVVADEDGVLVRYSSGSESCYVLDRIDVIETDSEVTITLQEGWNPANEVCVAMGMYYEVHVPLDTPIGDRAVIDGAKA